MKHLLPLAALLTSLPLPAQEEPPQAAFLNVVNLITLREPTRFSLGGFRFNGGEPVPPGENSGILAIAPGTHTFTIENPAAKPDKITVALTFENGKTMAVICYDEVAEAPEGGDEGKVRARLRHSVLVEGENLGPRLSLVSLLKVPFASVDISGKPVTLIQRQAHRVEIALGDAVKIAHGGRVLAEFEIAKPIHYLGFLYEDPGGGEVGLSLIQNEKLEYQPPLKDDP